MTDRYEASNGRTGWRLPGPPFFQSDGMGGSDSGPGLSGSASPGNGSLRGHAADTVETVLTELVKIGRVEPGQIVVIGASTSEVIGRRIGTSGTAEAAEGIFEGIRRVREKVDFFPAFQCCEHLNRALVVERRLLQRHPGLEPVTVVPVPKAGGSMAAYAYRTLEQAVVVEAVRAHAGIDIGSTLIGMHLRQVAVPVRPSIRKVGQAFVTMAFTRPKLIGGVRAVYPEDPKPGAESKAMDTGSCD